MKPDSLQSFHESGEEVGDSAADLRAVVSQSSLVQKRHLTVNTTPVSHTGVRFTTHTHTHTQTETTTLTRTLGMCCGSTMKNLSYLTTVSKNSRDTEVCWKLLTLQDTS